jgi:hypothetical protein
LEEERAAAASAPPAAAPAPLPPALAPPPPPPPAPLATSWALLPLHVPAACMAAAAASLASLLPGVRLSSHDVASGLVWTLRCALTGHGLPGEPGAGRFIVALDLASNGLPAAVLPDDWTGNCAAALSVSAPLWAGGSGSVAAAAPELRALAAAAAAVRAAVSGYRGQPLRAVRHLLACSARGGGGRAAWSAAHPAREPGEEQPLVGFATSCLRVPLAELDCGDGPPIALHYSTLPLRSTSGLLFASLAPGPRGDGVLVLLAASAAHAAQLRQGEGRAAAVLAACAPGARLLL